jgi:uncharacterized membrane protein YphA (DoxX/SURF4 family)
MFGLPATAVTNQLQNILLLVGGLGVAKGLFTSDQLSAVIGGITALITVFANYQTHQQALDTAPVPPSPKPASVAASKPGQVG